ncbi:hypothetical protein SMMN14_04375 [Sphaerulina musiva]
MPAGGTPLAPSVEKAYYRKCIQLKRRLNEIESANDDLKMRRLRLDRSIMKMRLERAFLLDELRKRTDHNIDGSDGSGDDGMATPPPDRPYRDKRRRQQSSSHGQAGPSQSTFQHVQYAPPSTNGPSESRASSSMPMVYGPSGQAVSTNAVLQDGSHAFVQQQPPQNSQTPALPHTSPYGPPPTGIPGSSRANGDGPHRKREEGARDMEEDTEKPAEPERSRGAGGFQAIND